MATNVPQTVLVGCEPNQVLVTIAEDDGNLFMSFVAATPEITDIDAVFFDVNDPSILNGLTVFPTGPEADITSFDVGDDSLTSLSNGATLQTAHDVRIQFGNQQSPSETDLDNTALTLFIDGGENGLSASDIDLSQLTVVINADYGQGLALTVPENDGSDDVEDDGEGDGPIIIETEVLALEDNFIGMKNAEDAQSVESADGWDIRANSLFTNGSNEGTLTLEAVDTDGPAAFFLDARVTNTKKFEDGGSAGDTLRIEVQVDGGEWVLLDEFVVNGDSSALVGSETGQTITDDLSTLSYDGGVLDDASESVQFRIISDFTANNEKLFIENLAVTATDQVEIIDDGEADEAEPIEVVTTESFFEDFDGQDTPGTSDLVADDGRWDVQDGQLFTNSANEGTLTFEAVDSDGPTSLSFDASTDDASRFENSGSAEDSFRVEVSIEGGEWILLDEFQVNDEGTALVGSQTGQTITEDSGTISYEGGVLDSAEGSVEYRLVNDATATGEVIRIDNVEITATNVEFVEDGGEDEGETGGYAVENVTFDDASAGDVAADQFAGVTISGQRAGDDEDSENDAMIFDTNNTTGGDRDLSYADQGNVVIISEDNDSDDPDDNAHGGTLTFDFDEPSSVDDISLLDIEEAGGTIDLFDADGGLISSVDIPAAGDNSAQTIEIGVENVAQMQINLVGSGAVDDLNFHTHVPEQEEEHEEEGCDGQYELIYEDIMAGEGGDEGDNDGVPADDAEEEDPMEIFV